MKKNPSIKNDLYNLCFDFIDKRLSIIQDQIRDIQESLTSETKSSAGDKHETGRAMLQLEREKAGRQLAEIQNVKSNLTKVDLTKQTEIISLGSVVFTSQFNYFICISAGELKVDDQSFFAIAPNTPLALQLMGKVVGDRVEFRGTRIEIKALL